MITKCRACHSVDLVSVLDLGEMAFAGHFPDPGGQVPLGRLELMLCNNCTLVQLREEFASQLLYGPHYGYRSGLNASMVKHLRDLTHKVSPWLLGKIDPVILDIGANDGTLLGQFEDRATLIGIDPLADKFAEYWRDDMVRINALFDAKTFLTASHGRRADVVFTIAMFYDLPDPVDFAWQVASILTDDGVWVLEQSDLSLMLKANAFDTVCHEHTEYYSLQALQFILREAGLRVIDVSFNSTNGGSSCLLVAKTGSCSLVPEIARDWRKSFARFQQRIDEVCAWTRLQLQLRKAQGKRVAGYGASTKGNVLLQYAKIAADLLPVIGEINPEKFGRETPGTHIPICSMAEIEADCYLVLPWHFRESIIANEQEFLNQGGELIFPLPSPSTYTQGAKC